MSRNYNNNYREKKQQKAKEEKRYWDVATVQERGDNKYWTKVGMAFQNEKGAFRVMLDALPVNGQLYIFPPE